MNKQDFPPWVDIQKRTFTNWINLHLKTREKKIEDLSNDLNDGIILIHLLEILSSQKIISSEKQNFNSQQVILYSPSQKIENINIVFNFLKQQGTKVVAITPLDIVQGNLKLILGLIWTIISKWLIQKTSSADAWLGTERHGDGRTGLLQWVNSVTQRRNVKNFTTDWKDGRLLAALANKISPGPLVNSDNDDALSLITNVVSAAETFSVPAIISPVDIISPDLDDLSMITYIALFRERYNQKLEDEEGEIWTPSAEGSMEFIGTVVDTTLREPMQDENISESDIAKKYNLHTPWHWKLNVFVLGLHIRGVNVPPGKIHDVRCKITVKNQIKRTSIIKKSDTDSFIWNESLQFAPVETCNITILIYCKNKILPNEKLARITIPEDQLDEGKAITKWFSIESCGEFGINITKSPAFIPSFKFAVVKSEQVYEVKDTLNEVKFILREGQVFPFELLDWRGNFIFNIAIVTFPKPVVDIYLHGASKPTLSIPISSRSYVLGLSCVEWLDICDKDTIKYMRLASEDNTCLGSLVVDTQDSVSVEVSPDKEFILILVSLLSLAIVTKIMF